MSNFQSGQSGSHCQPRRTTCLLHSCSPTLLVTPPAMGSSYIRAFGLPTTAARATRRYAFSRAQIRRWEACPAARALWATTLGGVPGCPCSVGNYVLRAKRFIRAGEELTYSYIGEHVLASSDELNERRALLERRWGFWCACPKCEEQEPKAQKPAEAETLVEAQKSEGELRGDQRGKASRAHEACGRSLRRRLAGSDAA